MQVPNVFRVRVPGGIALGFVADAALSTGAVLPGGVYSQCDDGGVALDIDHHFYVSYVRASAPTVLRSCRQENWAATYAAQDCYGLLWHSDHYDIYLPLGVPVTGPAAIVLLTGADTDFYVDAGTTYQPLTDGTHAYTTVATALAGGTLAYPSPGGLSTGTHTLGLSANRVAGLASGMILAITKDSHLWQIVPADESGTVLDITPAIPTLLSGATATEVLGVASDGTTTWILCDQVDGMGGWGLYVLSSTDLATWTTLRTIGTVTSGTPTLTALGVGEGGAVLIASGYTDTADTSGVSTLSWSYATDTGAPVALGTGADLLQGDLNLLYARYAVSLNPQPGWVSGADQNGFLALRFGAGPAAPILVSNQAIIDNAGAIDTAIFPLNVCDDGAGGLWAVEQIHGNLVHRAGAKGTAWVVKVTGLVATSNSVPHLAIARQVANSLICVHGFFDGIQYETQVSYVDLTTFAVTDGSLFDFPVETFDRIDGTTVSALYNQQFTSAAEAGLP